MSKLTRIKEKAEAINQKKAQLALDANQAELYADLAAITELDGAEPAPAKPKAAKKCRLNPLKP